MTDKQELSFQESKTTTVKMYEPYKLKLCRFAKGSKMELSINGNEYLADKIADKEGEIRTMVREFKKMCEEELDAVFIKDELE